MIKDLVYLETNMLQQDMRIRMPKSIIKNIEVVKGKTYFDIYFSKNENALVLKVANNIRR